VSLHAKEHSPTQLLCGRLLAHCTASAACARRACSNTACGGSVGERVWCLESVGGCVRDTLLAGPRVDPSWAGWRKSGEQLPLIVSWTLHTAHNRVLGWWSWRWSWLAECMRAVMPCAASTIRMSSACLGEGRWGDERTVAKVSVVRAQCVRSTPHLLSPSALAAPSNVIQAQSSPSSDNAGSVWWLQPPVNC
jgi:hypothetical protein